MLFAGYMFEGVNLLMLLQLQLGCCILSMAAVLSWQVELASACTPVVSGKQGNHTPYAAANRCTERFQNLHSPLGAWLGAWTRKHPEAAVTVRLQGNAHLP